MERLPENPFVELYENRLGVTFEVDPAYTEIKTIVVAPDWVQFVVNLVVVAVFLIVFGRLIVPIFAERNLLRSFNSSLSVIEGLVYDLTGIVCNERKK